MDTIKPRRSRRLDPERRERIIDATLDVIADHGVAGTTHRAIALVADVSLGSMTYHFRGMEDLLVAAFRKLAETASGPYAELLDAARTPEEARTAVVDIIAGNVWGTPRNLLLSYELYAFSARNPVMRHVMRDWLARSRKALGRHFDERTARALDALVEGLGIHNSVDAVPMSRADVKRIVDSICARS